MPEKVRAWEEQGYEDDPQVDLTQDYYPGTYAVDDDAAAEVPYDIEEYDNVFSSYIEAKSQLNRLRTTIQLRRWSNSRLRIGDLQKERASPGQSQRDSQKEAKKDQKGYSHRRDQLKHEEKMLLAGAFA